METILGGAFGLLLLVFVLIPIQVHEWLGTVGTALLVSGVIVAVQGIRLLYRRRRRPVHRASFKKD